MKKLKVSIIIPTYNQEKYIPDAINSALLQDYKDIEIILSDDNSTDNTSKIAKKFLKDKRFKYFKNKVNLGRVGNYHKALYDFAKGDYVLVLDGDDYLIDKSYIKKAINMIIKEKLIAVFAKQKVFLEKNKKLIEDKMNDNLPEIMDGNQLFLDYPKGYSIPHLSTLYNRKYAIKIGYYNEKILSSDWESFLRLILDNKVGFINKYVGVWRKHKENSSKSKNLDVIFNNLKYVENSYRFALKKNIISKKRLDKWRKQMLKRNFIKNLSRFLIIRDKRHYKLFINMVEGYDKKIYNSLLLDPRLLIIRIILINKYFTKILFRCIIKNESYLEDLDDKKI